MAIQYKADVLALLKAAGYPSTRIRAEKLLGQSYVQQLRKGELISWAALNTVCRLLLLPAVIYFIIFYYWPMAGLQIAFRDYRVSKGIWGSTWVGLKYFQKFFQHWGC